ncbi:MAG: response regulator [Acetobacteraceae bacterium]|nr:response regulator [Acetobacteraceae bacterium]
MEAGYHGLVAPDTRGIAPLSAGARLKAQRLAIGVSLVVVTLVCLFFLKEGGILQRAPAATATVERVGPSLEGALGSLGSAAQIIAEAMPSAPVAGASEGASRLLAEAMRLPSVFSAELLDASGRTLLLQHSVSGLTPLAVQFTEVGPPRNLANAMLLRSVAESADDSLLALRAYTPIGPDGKRRQVLIAVRSRDLLGIAGGATSAWLFASGGSLVSRPPGVGWSGVSDKVWRAWLNVRPSQPSGHFVVPMEDGAHVMVYRQLNDWPISLVIDGGLEATPLFPQRWGVSLAVWCMAASMVGLGLWCLLLGLKVAAPAAVPGDAGLRQIRSARLAASLPVSAPEMGPRILLVDDATPVRAYVAQRLRALGFSVVEAHDAAHAERIGTADVDVLVTEVVLHNNVDGSDLAARIRKRVSGLPVVFMSGFRSVNQTAAMSCDNLTSFTRKPVNVDELCLVIDGLLAQREPLSQRAMQSRP